MGTLADLVLCSSQVTELSHTLVVGGAEGSCKGWGHNLQGFSDELLCPNKMRESLAMGATPVANGGKRKIKNLPVCCG